VVYAQTRRGVVAFDRATGGVVTQFVVRSAPGRAAADPVVAGGRLYLAFDGTVYAVGGEP
jgi:outer membrane protein assembly factor BamB